MKNRHFILINYLLISICLALLVSCLSKRTGNTSATDSPLSSESGYVRENPVSHEIPYVNVRKKFPEKDFILQECGEVEYIPLETRPDVLLDPITNWHYCISDSLIITYNPDGYVFVFNYSGRILHVFNHKGRGPEEYFQLRDMTVDFSREEIYILDYPLYYRIWVYTLDGKYKRTLGTPEGMAGGLYIYNYGDYLLCYDRTKNTDYPEGDIVSPLNPQPYFLLNKDNGSVIKLNIRLKDFVANRVLSPAEGGKKIMHSSVGFVPIRKNGEHVYISDAALDTIYELRGTQAVPFMVKEPSVEDRDPPLLVWMTAKTNRYTFFVSIEKKFIPGQGHFTSPMFTVYDHKTGECYFSGDNVGNTDCPSEVRVNINSWYNELPENSVKAELSPAELLEAYKAGQLRGRLKEIASRLKEDDNPVLMLVKFKD